jgi:hypothetical protein
LVEVRPSLPSGEAEKFLFEDIYQVRVIWNGRFLFQYAFISLSINIIHYIFISCYLYEHKEEFILK